MENKKVILAYSGGLDTSFCVKYLSEDQKLDVHTVTVNLGGFDEDELKDIEKNALGMGAAKHYLIDGTAEYYRQCLRYLIFGNVLRNHIYPLSVSSERAFQAKVVALKAREIGARFVAHGSTGAGNDQVRFDLVFHTMIPGVEILTPIRDLRLSRQDEIEYLKKHGVKREWSKAKYSINKGLWGTSVGGEETKTSDKFLPGDAFPTQLETNDIEEIEISFEKGEVKGFSGQKFSNSLDTLIALGKHIAPYALGRDVHVGDTIIGIKGRIGFEAGLSLLVIRAHHLLEMHTLTKWQIYWKNQLSDWYGQMIHEGQFLAPVMRNIEGFLEDTQKYVTGSVICRLAPYRFQVLGIRSPHDLMSSDFGEYGEINLAWSGEDVKGFTKIQAVPHMVYNKVNKIDESL
jgi:argininosuccinate synthase